MQGGKRRGRNDRKRILYMTYKPAKQKMPADSQSFPEAVDESLEEGFVVGDSLEDVSICCHITDGPLAQPRAAQTEDVTVEREKHEDTLELKKRLQ